MLGSPACGRRVIGGCCNGDARLTLTRLEDELPGAARGIDIDERMVVGAERIGEIVAHPEFARLAGARVVNHDDNTGAVGRRRRHAEGHRLAFDIVGEDGDFLRDEASQRVVARARRIGTCRRSQSIDARVRLTTVPPYRLTVA
jgi:hypothetical protein